MTDSASSLLAILLGLGIFAIIVAIGWRSVQHRRVLRFQDAGKETIIVASEDDEVRSIDTTTTAETTQPAPPSPPSDLP